MNKEQQLEHVARDIENCLFCQENSLGKAVPGEGSPNAKIIFVGEAPGKQEAATGRPFVGQSGKLLRSLIAFIGLKEKGVFITSVGKYLPVSGTPTSSQIVHGRCHLLKQIAIIEPKIVVLLGSVAVQGVLGEKIPIRKFHGTTQEREGRRYYLTLHPAAALRFPQFRKELESDFQQLKKLATDIL